MMVDIKIVMLPFVLLFFSCNANKNNYKAFNKPTVSEKKWQIASSKEWAKNQGLLNVESIIYDEENQVFYVSNGKNYELSTNGFIAKISENGALVELKWVNQLNRPTGMAIHNSWLYVADVNALVVINTKNGKIVKKILAPVANAGLNDVAINKKGEIYVSASFVHSIYKLNGENLELWCKEEEKLKWANGLIADENEVIVAGLTLNNIKIDSKQISEIELNVPAKDFDGITPDDLGGYFLTTVESRSLFYLNPQKKISKLRTEDIYFGDLVFNPNRKELYIPRGNKKTGEFFISVLAVE